MTISIINQSPEPGDNRVSPQIHPSFTIFTDNQVDLATVNVWAANELMIEDGVSLGESTIEATGFGGYGVIIAPRKNLAVEEITIRVMADDDDSSVDESWTFTVFDFVTPIIASATPEPWSIVSVSPATIDISLIDVGGELVQLRHNAFERVMAMDGNQLSFTVTDEEFVADGSVTAGSAEFHTAGAITFDAQDLNKWISVRGERYKILTSFGTYVVVDREFDFTASALDWTLYDHSLEGAEGLLFSDVLGTGERRVITSVQGPGLATYDGASLSGTNLVRIYKAKGIDVYVDGQRIAHSGFLDADAALAGWLFSAAGAGWYNNLTLTPPAPWSVGDRVDVFVRMSDDREVQNTNEIGYYFEVGDTRGPQIIDIDPPESTRGIDGSASPASDLAFTVYCEQGVDNTALNVEVNGVAAITAGVGVGDYSTSTVTVVSPDQTDVVLKKGSAYTDGEIVFVDIESADSSARAGERRVLRFQFGTTVDSQAVVHGLTGDIVRVLAYDLSATSFGDPVALGHTGYAWDGYWYDEGARGEAQASWFLELGAFPLSGHVIVTTGGWAIVRALDSGPWMTCAVNSNWSMAGRGPITDADFGPGPKLALSSVVAVVVDFDLDRARKFDYMGLIVGATDVEHRNDNQASLITDSSYVLPTGPYTKIALACEGEDLILATTTASHLALITDLSTEAAEAAVERVGSAPASVTSVAYAWDWARLRLAGDMMVLAYNDAGQGQVEIWDWAQFATGGSMALFLDDASTPALPAVEVRDVDLVWPAVAMAMVGEVDVLDFDALAITAYDEATLGLSGVAGAEVSAVALEPNFTSALGTLYASVSAAADGRVVSFRVPSATSQVLDSGNPAPFLSAIGSTRHNLDSYVNASMEIA